MARGISSSGQSTKTEVPAKPSTLTKDEQKCLNELLEKYQHCFAANNSEIGNTNISMEITLTSSVPVCYRPYRLSYYERELVRKIVDDLLKNDIIEPSTSPYASPILLVKKKNGEMLMCVDYR